MMFSREYGKKKNVSYAYIRLFGCRAFLYFYKDERSKLDNKIKQYLFLLSSEDDEFSYRLWDLKEKKIIRSIDVIFFEDQTIKNFKQKKKIESTNFIHVNSDASLTP